MSKKALTVLLAAALASAGLMTGCGSNNNGGTGSEGNLDGAGNEAANTTSAVEVSYEGKDMPIDAQLQLIADNSSLWEEASVLVGADSIGITDLDRDGRLEVIFNRQSMGLIDAADCCNIYEVDAAGTALKQFELGVDSKMASALFANRIIKCAEYGDKSFHYDMSILNFGEGNSYQFENYDMTVSNDELSFEAVSSGEESYSAASIVSHYFDASGNEISEEKYSELTHNYFANASGNNCEIYYYTIGWQLYASTDSTEDKLSSIRQAYESSSLQTEEEYFASFYTGDFGYDEVDTYTNVVLDESFLSGKMWHAYRVLNSATGDDDYFTDEKPLDRFAWETISFNADGTGSYIDSSNEQRSFCWQIDDYGDGEIIFEENDYIYSLFAYKMLYSDGVEYDAIALEQDMEYVYFWTRI